jgi:uncharacterized protein (UPF0261 family)
MSIAIVGMLDEREPALRLIKDRIEQRGHKTCLIDISVGTGAIVPSLKPDVSGRDLIQLVEKSAGAATIGERTATSIMTEGLKVKIADLHRSAELQGMIAITGMTGALISLPAMKQLPFGFPKLLISGTTSVPYHANKFSDYFALRDITVMSTVVDTVGMNSMVMALAINGANAISGMVEGGALSVKEEKPSIAITEFGFCDKGAHYIRELLEGDYNLVSFHATGFGDKAVMDLVPQGLFKAFVDLVPGAFSEYLLGGNRSMSGPDRLDVAAPLQIPYIFCPGGFDIISCGPLERRDTDDPVWKSRKLAERKLFIQDPPRVQARVSPEESEFTASAVAERLNRYQNKARVKAVIPRNGFTSLSTEDGPLYDPAPDSAFRNALKAHLDPAIEVIEVDSDINDPLFAKAVVETLLKVIRESSEV